MLRSSFVICTLCFILLLVSPLLGKALPTDRLLYLSGEAGQAKLYAIDIHRGLAHKLNDMELYSYTISPDGERILFKQSTNGRTLALFTMNLTSGDVRQLVELLTGVPEWSPDSQSIVFRGYDETSRTMQIYSTDRDGNNLKVLRNLSEVGNPYYLSWSPDGTRILFQVMTGRVQYNTYLMNADGSDLHQLSFSSVNVMDPRWSPDNRYLAFIGRTLDGQNTIIESSLCLRTFDSYTMRCLVDDVFTDFAWSPDGQYIAYIQSTDYGVYNFGILNIETEETLHSVPTRFTKIRMKWTPDGNALVYEQFVTEDRQLYFINVDGTGEKRLTDNLGGAYAAAWWPDD